MPEAKPSAIAIATEMLNHHVPGFAHSEEFAKRLVEALALKVVSAAVDKLVDVEAEPEIITLRNKLLERSKVKRDRARAMEDSPSEILTKCKLEGEQRGYYDAYCMADQIVTESAGRVRAALMAGVAQYFDGVEKI